MRDCIDRLGANSTKGGSKALNQPSLVRRASRCARARLLVAAVLVSALDGCGGVSRDTLGQAAALHSAIKAISSQLRDLSSDAAATGDHVLKDRIEQAANDIDRLLPALDAVINGSDRDGAAAIHRVSGELVAVLASLSADGAKVGTYASAKLNSALALISQMITGVPGIDLAPVILAISPSRVDVAQQSRPVKGLGDSPGAPNADGGQQSLPIKGLEGLGGSRGAPTADGGQEPRPIKLFGHLPGEPNKDVVVTMGGKTVPVSRTAGNAVAFTIPREVKLTEEQVVPFKVSVRKRSGLFGLSSENVDFEEQLVVGKQTPFSCTVETYEEHPEHLEKVNADKAVSYELASAGGKGPATENKRLLAAELFVETVKDAAQYDPNTAVLVDTGEKLFPAGGNCGYGPSGGARIVASGRAVEVSLHAPRLARRKSIDGWRIRSCDEADTKIAMTLKPTFLAARRDSGALTLKQKDTVGVGFSGAQVSHQLAEGTPWAVHVKCDFSEAAEQWQTWTMVLTNADKEEAGRGIGVRVNEEPVAGNRMLWVNLEPFDPLRFADQLP